jgi:hypothetical protein
MTARIFRSLLNVLFGVSADDIFDQAAMDMFDQMDTKDAVFTPAVGDPVPCKINLEFDVDLEPHGFDSQVWSRGTTIEAILNVLGKEPDKGETFTVGETDYTVQTVQENDGRFVKVVVK